MSVNNNNYDCMRDRSDNRELNRRETPIDLNSVVIPELDKDFYLKQIFL